MNNRELKVKRKYEADGWRMLRGGAPDFVALKVSEDGNILESRGIEVKRDGSQLTYEQAIYRKIFELAGIPYIVEVEK
jgi:hypothetical protein